MAFLDGTPQDVEYYYFMVTEITVTSDDIDMQNKLLLVMS